MTGAGKAEAAQEPAGSKPARKGSPTFWGNPLSYITFQWFSGLLLKVGALAGAGGPGSAWAQVTHGGGGWRCASLAVREWPPGTCRLLAATRRATSAPWSMMTCMRCRRR